MITITGYNIPLNVRISQEEYDKIIDSKLTKSDFVRFAIDSYDVEEKIKIELSKREVIEDILENVINEQDKFKKKILEQMDLQEENIQSNIKQLHQNCDLTLNNLEDEIKNNTERENDSEKLSHDEEKILEILPTLQRIYHSEFGLSYEKIKFQASRIGISPITLKHWVDENQHLLIRGDNLKK